MAFIPYRTSTGLREIGNIGATGGAGTIPVYNYITNVTSMDISLQQIAWSFSSLSGVSPDDAGSLMTCIRVQAQAVNDIASMQANHLEAYQAIATNLTSIAAVLTGISGQIAAGVTTQQLQVADQIKNNRFQQITTNAALKRSDLPETVVPADSLASTFKATSQDVVAFKAQITAANLVQQGITDSVAYGQTLAVQYLKDTFVGEWGGKIKGFFKGFIKTTQTEIETKKIDVQANAAARGSSLIYKPPTITP